MGAWHPLKAASKRHWAQVAEAPSAHVESLRHAALCTVPPLRAPPCCGNQHGYDILDTCVCVRESTWAALPDPICPAGMHCREACLLPTLKLP